MRDFFYSPTMNGVDWKAMHDKYAALLPYVNHRNDLTYLIGELIGELNNGHSYVAGGERPETPRIKLGLLGAELSRDPGSRAYRIDRILPGENWDKENRSPLTAIGLNLKPGDYILAVNGTPVSSLPNIYDALIGTADKQVICALTLSRQMLARAISPLSQRQMSHRFTILPGSSTTSSTSIRRPAIRSAMSISPIWANQG